MILLDATALLALLSREPAADDVAGLLRERDCAITSVNLAEVVDQAVRRVRVEPERLRAVLGGLLDGGLEVRPIEAEAGWRAGELRARHYQRETSALSLADCSLLAAIGSGDELATADAPLAAAARAEGIAVIALANSAGERP